MKKKMFGLLLAALMLAAFMLSGCGAADSEESVSESTDITETSAPESEDAEKVTESADETESAVETEAVEETEEPEIPQETEEVLDAETADASTEIQFGTNQNDAVLIPLNTKVYGTLTSEYYWCAFTTGSDIEADYRITFIDKTASSEKLYAVVFDEYGTEISSREADPNGLASTFSLDELEPNTTYYVRFKSQRDKECNLVIIIRNINEVASGIKTSDNIASYDTNTIAVATNMDDAELVPVGTKIEATITNEHSYYAFVATVDGEYKITTVDETSSSEKLYITLYDEYGTKLASGEASPNGTASTFSSGELLTGTTYYYCITSQRGKEATYTIIVREPEGAAEENVAIVIEEEAETEALLFTVPFEINSTQVQFVINSDKFMDEEAAKTAVEPVAEALLAYPDHSILIAGTTATDGTQESCVKLSERRANAVKNLLVEEFGVPESQIQTIGLGYEADPFERGQDREVAGDITSKFIESEGKKNRRVVIMDIDSEIAQEILASN
ncbi:MAG: OmpA family protein [Oscillospiraceae bacterium]|nr:OmpA family protein [Oscillospiraceae bacterium]